MSDVSLGERVLVVLGPLRVTESMLTSVALSAALVLLSRAVTRRLELVPGRLQGLLELVVSTIAEQVEQVTGRDGTAHVPLLGTLFLFIAAANLTLLLPGVHPPTEHVETPLALALVVLGWWSSAGPTSRGSAPAGSAATSGTTSSPARCSRRCTCSPSSPGPSPSRSGCSAT